MSSLSLKEHIIQNVESRIYYASRFPDWKGQNVICPFHEDDTPSLSINLKNGGAKCHSAICGIAFGNIVHFEANLKNISEREAANNLYQEFIRPWISPKIYSPYLANAAKIRKVAEFVAKAGKIAEEYHIGWSESKKRLTFPIINPWNKLVNIRFYKPKDYRLDSDVKIYSFGKGQGYGVNEFWPWPRMLKFNREIPWYFMASERETLMALAMGLQAFCCTAGEGNFPKPTDYQKFFEGLKILTVFDNDKAGQAADSKAAEYFKYAESVEKLPLGLKEGQDFADWVFAGGTKKDIVFIQPESIFSFSGSTSKEPQVKSGLKEKTIEGIFNVSDISNNPKTLNHIIEVHGVVAAKSSVTYSLPIRFRVDTDVGSKEIKITPGRKLLRFIKSKDEVIYDIVRKKAKTEEGRVTPLEWVTATEVEIIPLAAIDKTISYTMQRCFYLGCQIDSNVAYKMHVMPTSETRTQQTVGLILDIEPIHRALDTFAIDDSTFASLYESFRPEGKVWDKLAGIAKCVSENYSYISNRDDWHIATLLSWCSPLMWKFPNENEMQRGWINTLCLGDTETGKSRVTRTFQRITNSGTFVSAENSTFVGLIGGAVKTGSDQFMLKWGRIPLADRQLVVVEELSGLSVKEISNMSDVRSSGIARLDKGGLSAETNARTRLIFLSNVRNPKKTLADYLSGVTAVQELIGHGEDISRFDLIITLIDTEVSVNVINSKRTDQTEKEKYIHTKDFEALIKFIWSLKPDQIIFTEAAYEECLLATRKLSEIYHPSIPIFKGGSGRYKIGRIAAAIACATFNYYSNESAVVVEEKHVKCAVRFLKMLYDKSSLGYLEYSNRMYDRSSIGNVEELTTGFRLVIPARIRSKVADSLIHAARFTRDELQAVAGLANYQADQLIGLLLREKAVRKGDANLWEITKAGKSWLKRFLRKS